MKLKHRTNQAHASSSPRDAIETWLDVLVSMLNLPPSQRTHVRDELEDHLRSRVDDLLITGTPEPDAIRQAVSELGETAQLAKTITAANRTHHPFRRFAMHTLITIAAGSLIALGITANNASSTTNTATLPQSKATESHAELAALSADPFSSFSIDGRDSTIGDLFQQIDQNTDKPVIVHWGALAAIAVNKDTPLEIDSQPITAGLILTILAERSERAAGDAIAVLEKADRIEVGTRSQFDRRTSEKRVYDLSMFIEPETQSHPVSGRAQVFQAQTRNATQNIIALLQTHVSPHDWTTKGGDLASATAINSTLVITAPERMHAEIDALLRELGKQSNAQQREHHAQTERAFERIRAEYEAAKRAYIAKSNEFGRIELRGRQIEQRMERGELSGPDFEQDMAELGDLGLMLKELRLELNEQERRYESLQSLLIDAERDQLRAQLYTPISSGSGEEQPSGGGIVYIVGPEGVRSGAYQLPEIGKLTLARFLMAANAGDVSGTVKIRSEGRSHRVGDVADILSGKVPAIELRSEDQVVISATD